VGADTDNQVVIRSTGTSGRATQTVNLLVQPSDYAPDDALRVNNHLTISGSSLQVQGACASLRVPSPADAAVDIAVSGTNIVVEKGIYTNGTSSPSGTPSYYKIQCAPGTCPPSGSWTMTAITENTFVPAAPTVDPTRYAKYADYLLSGDGYMYQWTSSAVDVGTCSSPCANPSGWTKLTIKDGGGTYTVTPPSCIKGWQFQSGTPNTWTDSGCSATNFVEGTFYIKGKGNLQNNHGTLATPMHVTIITEKALTISGSQSFQWDNLTTTSTPTASINPTAPKDIQFVAGTDVSLTNNLANGGVQGAILAHEQISIAGSSSVINGTLVAEDHCNQNLPVGCGGDNTVLDNTLAGSSIRINYTCGLKPVGLGSTLQVKKWVTQ
jgi:cytoskeletal protein CcmA (bactofilin family)